MCVNSSVGGASDFKLPHENEVSRSVLSALPPPTLRPPHAKVKHARFKDFSQIPAGELQVGGDDDEYARYTGGTRETESAISKNSI